MFQYFYLSLSPTLLTPLYRIPLFSIRIFVVHSFISFEFTAELMVSFTDTIVREIHKNFMDAELGFSCFL